jgi:hypothetical protein
MHLQVHIAERTTDSRQQITNWPGGPCSISELDLIIERAVRTWWRVQESLCSGDGFACELAFVRRQHLPDPPDTIDHAVVQIKYWVARTGEHVVAGIATDSVVASAMDADLKEEVSVLFLPRVSSSSQHLRLQYQVHLA